MKSKSNLNIALLTDGITPFVTGGMQRHSANLAKYFTLHGVQVTLVHCVLDGQIKPSDNQINQELFGEQSEIKLHKIVTLNFPKAGKVPGHYVRNSYQYSKELFNQVDFSEIDFVYAKGYSGWYYMEQKQKGLLLPPIGVKFHGYEMYQELPNFTQKLKAKLLRKATKWNNEHADYIFSYGGKITELILDRFNVDASKVLDFTSGLDVDWLRKDKLQPSGSRVRFVFIGRAEVRKGIVELSKAIKTLIAKYDFDFHFIGPIPDAMKVGHNHVNYHGELNSKEAICQVLDQMDVLVCPSHAEGMPNVILEGMARGLAILATDVGAVEKIVSPSNGILIQALDQEKLTAAIIEFMEMDSSEIFKKRNNSLEKIIQTYLWDKIIVQIIQAVKSQESNCKIIE